MKGKRLKLWQSILLAFSTVTVATGGVVLYTYLTTGFESPKIQPEGISFKTDENYNPNTNQFEIDSSFNLTISATNDDVTEKSIVLSFEKSLSTDASIAYSETIKNGIKYISNGIVTVPQNVNIGEAFRVDVNQERFISGQSYTKVEDAVEEQVGNYFLLQVSSVTSSQFDTSQTYFTLENDSYIIVDNPVASRVSEYYTLTATKATEFDENEENYYTYSEHVYYANVGGILTLVAKTVNELDVKDAKINIAVDVPVDSVKLYVENAEVKEEAYKILQSSTFSIGVNYYPASSKFRYSDNLFEEFYGVEKDVRQKDYCFDSADINVVKHYNDGDVYFTSNNIISQNNSVDFYLFKTAKAEEKFEASVHDLEGEVYYNAMIAYFVATPKTNIISTPLKFSIEQAEVGSVVVTNKSFTGTTNKLFTLSVNSNSFGDGSLGLGIANKEGENLASSMISQIALQISYTKAGETKTELTAEDGTIVVKGALGEVILGEGKVTSPYLFEKDGKTYYLLNASMKNLNNAYWEISTQEDSIEIELQVVLFILDKDEGLTLFDDGNSASRLVTLTISKHDDAAIDWQGEKTIAETIIHSGADTFPGHVDATQIINVPRDNIYQTTRYYIANATGTITADDANINTDIAWEHDGRTYYQATSGDLFFRTAGTYYVRFVTIRTDAYGKVIKEYDEEIIEKFSSELRVDVSETLQAFVSETIVIKHPETNGVFKKTEDDEQVTGKDYYTFENNAYTKWAGGNFDAAKGSLYEVSYYALKTGSDDALELSVTVGEESTQMLIDEAGAGRLEIYAISSDGSIKVQLTIGEITGNANVATIPLSIDDSQIEDIDGKGKAFYIEIDYFNTVSHLITPVYVTENPRTSNLKQCFMIYTQTPQSIQNTFLKGKTLTASIILTSSGAYDECNITYVGNNGELSLKEDYDKPDANPPKIATDDKDALNKRILETIIFDGYGRIIDIAPYVSIKEENISSVYIKGNKAIEFANGDERVTIKVATDESVTTEENENKFFMFVINTTSYGLAQVEIDGQTFEGQALSNVNYDVDGQKDAEIDFSASLMTIYVGKQLPGGGYNSLDNKYIYVKNENPSKLKDMLVFYKGDAAYDNNALTSTSPITKIKVLRDFYADGSLKLLVSNKDFSWEYKETSDLTPQANKNYYTRSGDVYTLFAGNTFAPGTTYYEKNETIETVSFEVTINFKAFVTPTLNLNEKAAGIKNVDNILDTGIYAGYQYNLDSIVKLNQSLGIDTSVNEYNFNLNKTLYYVKRNGKLVQCTNDDAFDPNCDYYRKNDGQAISWAASSYSGTRYIRRLGSKGVIDSQPSITDDIGMIIKDNDEVRICFYDVTEITPYTVELYYYSDNTYCYYGDIAFTVYPNLYIYRNEEKISLVEIATETQAQVDVKNYFETKRIRTGYSLPDNIVYQITDKDAYVVGINGGNFEFDAANALNLAYGLLDDNITVGLFLKDGNGNNVAVKNADGENLTTSVAVNVGTDLTTIAGVLLDSKDGNRKLNSDDIKQYNGREVLLVDSETSKYVKNEDEGILISGTNYYFFKILTYRTSYSLGTGNTCNFVAHSSDFNYGNDIYLSLQVQANVLYYRVTKDVVRQANKTYYEKKNVSYEEFTEEVFADNTTYYEKVDGRTTVAQIKVPLLISGVGLDFVKYTGFDGNDIYELLNGSARYAATTDTSKQAGKTYYTKTGDVYSEFTGNAFEKGVTYYEFSHKYPFEEMIAGCDYQISYNAEHVGLYRDREKVQITSVAFVDEDSELGTTYIDGNGEWHVQFANLANSHRFATLVVYYARGTSSLRFTYRIKLMPNIQTQTIYPFADGSDGSSEFIKVDGNATYELSNAFGSYAGSKSDKTRFNFYLGTNKPYDENVDYYVKLFTEAVSYDANETYYVFDAINSAFEVVENSDPANIASYYVKNDIVTDVNGKISLIAGTTILTNDGVQYNDYVTLANSIRIEGFGEADEDGYIKLNVVNVVYSINNIAIKSNGGNSGTYTSFEDLSDGQHSIEITTSGSSVTYNITASTAFDGTRTFVLASYSSNETTPIATISFSESGRMIFSNVNTAYAISLNVVKTYSSTVNGNLNYKINVNENSGIYYVFYEAFEDYHNQFKNGVTQEVEGEFPANPSINMVVWYASADKSSHNVVAEGKNITLTKTATLLDRHGDVVTENSPISDISLSQQTASDWIMTITKDDFVSQDYTLIIYITASYMENNAQVSELISTLTLSIPCSIKETQTLQNVSFYAGKQISVDEINTGFKFNNNTINITSFEIISDENYDDFIEADGTIKPSTQDINNVLVKFDFVYGGSHFYRDILINIKANVTTQDEYRHASKYYAGDEGEIDLSNFYGVVDLTTLDVDNLTMELTNSPEDFDDDHQIVLDKTNGKVKFTSKDVAEEVQDEIIRLQFTYTDGDYTFSWSTVLKLTISPNTTWEVTYPDPITVQNEKNGHNLTGESVVAGKEYEDFFKGEAPLAEKNRIAAEKWELNENKFKPVDDLSSAKIKIKTLTNATVTVDGVEKEVGDEFDVNTDFTFGISGEMTSGTIVFEIELNAVVVTYNVYVFKDTYVDAETATLIHTADGETNTLFLEALQEGNIFAENTIAKVTMPANISTGAYYIKINGSNANQWVGFSYDTDEDDNVLYVHIGKSVDEILGIYSTKLDGALDLRETAGIKIELTSFVKLKYKTIKNGVADSVYLADFVDYTAYANNNKEVSDPPRIPLIKLDDGYYKIVDRNVTKVNDLEADKFTYYVNGTYNIYDKNITGNIYASTSSLPLGNTDGLEQELTKSGNIYSFGGHSFDAANPVGGYYSYNNGEYYFKGNINADYYATSPSATTYQVTTQSTEFSSSNFNLTGVNLNRGQGSYIFTDNTNANKKYYVAESALQIQVRAHSYASVGTFSVEGGTYTFEPTLGSEVEVVGNITIGTESEHHRNITFSDGTNTYTNFYVLDSVTNIEDGTQVFKKNADEDKIAPYDINIGETVVGGFYVTSIAVAYDFNSVNTSVQAMAMTLNQITTGIPQHVQKLTAGTAENALINAFGLSGYYVTRGSNNYLVSTLGDQKYFLQNVTDVYKSTTRTASVNGKVIAELIDQNGKAIVELSKNGGYVQIAKSEINLIKYESDDYVLADMNTYSITSIEGLTTDDVVKVTFNHVIDKIVGSFVLKFKLDVDLEVQNQYDNKTPLASAKKLEWYDNMGEKVTWNYMEIEVNKTYDFNSLVGITRKSTGEVITAADVIDSSTVSLQVISSADNDKVYNALKDVLKDELKDNSDVIRFAFELVKANASENSPVYNFNIRARGADNLGDYVLVKYTYTMNVLKNSFTKETEGYNFESYVIFKLLPDYKVEMKDIDGNVLLPDADTTSIVTNSQSVSYVTDFETIGALVENSAGETLENIDSSVSKFTITDDGSREFSYKYGYGKKDEFSENGAETALVYNKDGKGKIYFVNTNDIEVNGTIHTIKSDKKYLVNLNLVVTTNDANQNGLVKVTSQNAVDSLRDLSSLLFDATLDEETSGDIATYLDKGYSKWSEWTDNTVPRNNGGMKLLIKNDVCLGQRNFIITLKDVYDYTIEYHVSLVASSNPTFAKGTTFFKEGNTFDIGTQFEKVEIASWKTKTGLVYEENNSGSAKFKQEVAELYTKSSNYDATADYYIKSGNNFNKVAEPNEDNFAQYSLLNVISSLNANLCKYDTSNGKYYIPQTENDIRNHWDKVQRATQLKDTDVIVAGKTYYKKHNGLYYQAVTDPQSETKTDLYLIDTINIESLYYLEDNNYKKATTQEQLSEVNIWVIESSKASNYDASATYYTRTGEAPKYVYTKVTTNSESQYKNYFTQNGPYYQKQTGQKKGKNITYFYLLSLDEIVDGQTYYVRDDINGTTGVYKDISGVSISANDKSGSYYVDETYNSDYYLKVKYGAGANDFFLALKSGLYAESVTTTIEDPIAVPPTNDNDLFKGTVVLTGINAFGYDATGIESQTDGKYFTDKTDLEKIKIKRIYYTTLDGTFVETVYDDATGIELATAGADERPLKDYYKYNSATKMGRYSEGNFTVPVLPGWAYEDQDRVTLLMNVVMNYDDNDNNVHETYTTKVPVTIEKETQRMVTLNTTNISDNTSIKLSDHLKPRGSATFDYYDDTIAVTLPARGKVTVNIAAFKTDYSSSATYYTFNTETKSYVEVAINNEDDFYAGKYYVQIGTSKKPACDYVGTQDLQSEHNVDFTYYVGISRTVGHTLDNNYHIRVTFTDYDNTKITREGHYGFYASYVDGSVNNISGQDGVLTAGYQVNYVYGYAKRTSDPTENEGRFTAIKEVVGTKDESEFNAGKYYVLAGSEYVKAIVFDESETYYTRSGTDPDYVYTKATDVTSANFADGTYYIYNYYKYFKANLIGNFDTNAIYYLTMYIPTENIEIVDSSTGRLTRDTSYIFELKGEENAVRVMESFELQKIIEDKLHIADAYNLTNGRQNVTKYYIGYGNTAADKQYYQLVKSYYVYPTYFNIDTEDYNDSVHATTNDASGILAVFDFNSWADQVLLKYYDNANGLKDTNASAVNINPFYFELGNKNTTDAFIDRESGQITVETSEYALNGQEFITINVYVKASGETGSYTDDNLKYSGNLYNTPAIQISVYLSKV